MLKRARQSKTGVWLLAWFISSYIRFVRATSSIVRDPADTDAKLLSHQPIIFAMWHGQMMMIPTIKPRTEDLDVQIMVARHMDAEVIAQTLRCFGMNLIRGTGAGNSGKDKGGAAALRAALKWLKRGSTVALTADMHPGPGKKAGMGIITIAKLSGQPIVPCAVVTSRRITLNTWNTFTINLPFSKLGIVVGDPIAISRDLDEEGAQAARQAVEDGLNKVTERAYELVGSSARKVLQLSSYSEEDSKPGFRLKAYRFLTNIARPIAPLILSRRVRRGKEDPERQNERLGIASAPRPDGQLIWFHAASVGETNAVLPLIARLEQTYPNAKVLLTTGTVTSAQLAKERLPSTAIHQYVPLDSPQFVSHFLDHWRPDLALFTESEIWPNLILQSAARDIPLMLLNGRMSKKSYRSWRRQSGLSIPLFSRFDLILAQNDVLADRFRLLGAPQARSVGNLKIDCPAPPVDQEKLAQLKEAAGERPILVAASTHPGEDEIVADAHSTLRKTFPDLLTVIIPRHPERGEAIAAMLTARGIPCSRRALGALPDSAHEIYIADTMGELGTFYSLSPIAFIGGSLVPRGGQNPIEAVKLGAAVIVGPHRYNFKDAYKEMIRLKGCKEIKSAAALADSVRILLQGEAQLRAMVRHGEEALQNLDGALEQTLEALEPYLTPQQGPQGMRRAS